jgi:hypothetical protein
MQKKVDTYTTWLGDELRMALKPLKSFISIMEQFDSQNIDPALVTKIGTVLQTLYGQAENQFEEILSFTEKKLGHIRLVAARPSFPEYKGGELLNAELIAEYEDGSTEPEELPQIIDFKDNEF